MGSRWVRENVREGGSGKAAGKGGISKTIGKTSISDGKKAAPGGAGANLFAKATLSARFSADSQQVDLRSKLSGKGPGAKKAATKPTHFALSTSPSSAATPATAIVTRARFPASRVAAGIGDGGPSRSRTTLREGSARKEQSGAAGLGSGEGMQTTQSSRSRHVSSVSLSCHPRGATLSPYARRRPRSSPPHLSSYIFSCHSAALITW